MACHSQSNSINLLVHVDLKFENILTFKVLHGREGHTRGAPHRRKTRGQGVEHIPPQRPNNTKTLTFKFLNPSFLSRLAQNLIHSSSSNEFLKSILSNQTTKRSDRCENIFDEVIMAVPVIHLCAIEPQFFIFQMSGTRKQYMQSAFRKLKSEGSC